MKIVKNTLILVLIAYPWIIQAGIKEFFFGTPKKAVVTTTLAAGALCAKKIASKNNNGLERLHPNEDLSEMQIPIIYHPDYNISFWGLEKLHPFDSKKYGKIYSYLKDALGIAQEKFYTPSMVTDEQLQSVHTKDYLDSLKQSSTVARITEIPFVAWLPQSTVENHVLNPMKLATGGTILGAQLAQKYGIAINLSGGYHHAKADSASGFCVYADIPLAAQQWWKTRPHDGVMVIDLDAHQGNGHEAIFAGDKRVTIFDMYNAYIYPADTQAKKHITFNHELRIGCNDAQYLAKLKDSLPKALDSAKPAFIIYNAGTDIFQEDRLGAMAISKDAIIERDSFVFEQARQRNIPILMVLSGGYSKRSWEIVAHSIERLLVEEKKRKMNPILGEQKAQWLLMRERELKLGQHTKKIKPKFYKK